MTKERATVILALIAGVIVVLAILLDRLTKNPSRPFDAADQERILSLSAKYPGRDQRLLLALMNVLRIFITGYWGVVLATVTTLGTLGVALNGWFELDKLRPLLLDLYDLIRDALGRPSRKSSSSLLFLPAVFVSMTRNPLSPRSLRNCN